MTGEQLFAVMENIDEKHIAQERSTVRAYRPVWIRWCAVAACLFLIIGFMIPRLKHKEPNPDMSENAGSAATGLDDPANVLPAEGGTQSESSISAEPGDEENDAPSPAEPDSRIDSAAAHMAPSEVDRHIIDLSELGIELNYLSGGAGGQLGDKTPVFTGTYQSLEADVHDLLDVSGMNEESLPVYRIIASLRTGEDGSGAYESIMQRLEQEWNDFYSGTGVEDDPTVELNLRGSSTEHPLYTRMRSAGSGFYGSAPAIFTFDTLIENSTDVTEETILSHAESDLFFQSATAYLNMTDPVVLSRENDADKHFTIYQRSDDLVDTMYNIFFRSISLDSFGGLSFSGMVMKASSVEYVGDGAIRTYEEAVREAVSVYGIAEEDILAYDIGYYGELTPEYYIPCYRFIVNTHGQYFFHVPNAPEPEDLECIDIIVPAVVLG